MHKHSHPIHDLIHQLRRHASSTPLMGKLRNSPGDWQKLCSAMDNLSLTTEILLRNLDKEETTDYFDASEIINTTLQHCVMQYDAFASIYKLLLGTISDEATPACLQLRRARVHVAAHPTNIWDKESKETHTAHPGHPENTSKKFAYIIRKPDGSSEIVEVALAELACQQLAEIEALFDNLDTHLSNKLIETIQAWSEDSLSEFYEDSLLSYSHEKIGVYGKQRPMPRIAAVEVVRILDKVKHVGKTLDDRVGSRTEYPGIDDTLRRINAAGLFLLGKNEELETPIPESLAEIIAYQMISDSEALAEGLHEIESRPDIT